MAPLKLFSALVVGFFTVADRTGWRLKRYDLIDRVIKGKLKKLKGKRLPVRVSFPVVYVGFLLGLLREDGAAGRQPTQGLGDIPALVERIRTTGPHRIPALQRVIEAQKKHWKSLG